MGIGDEPTQTVRQAMNGPIWVRVLFFLGFPTFVALLLLGVILGIVPSTLSAGIGKLDIKAEAQALAMRAVVEELTAARIERLWLLRMICRNTAPGEAAKLECDRATGPIPGLPR